jgi:deazaflavin-dependent oxidoreductase (nitroreductase family)
MAMTTDPRTAYARARQTLIDEIREHGHAVTGSYVGRKALVLTTVGAKTGERRESPVAYSLDGDRYVIVASKGGADEHPAWYFNLLADPLVTIEVNRLTFRARATVAEGDERDRLWSQHVAEQPGIGEYPGRTRRVIPVVVLTPVD